MRDYEKFESRLKEVSLYDEWCNVGKVGRVGIETEAGISIFVHECDGDAYSEFTFPPMKEMSADEDFRRRALSEFSDAGDEQFIRNLVRWYINSRAECPLYPIDVYFLWQNQTYVDFEDDIDHQTCVEDETTEEYCPHCDSMVDLSNEFKVQRCPNCGKWIVPCSICPLDQCSKHCPLERYAIILNEE